MRHTELLLGMYHYFMNDTIIQELFLQDFVCPIVKCYLNNKTTATFGTLIRWAPIHTCAIQYIKILLHFWPK